MNAPERTLPSGSSRAEPGSREPRIHGGVLAILAILPFIGWWLYGLFDLDEGFYAAVVAEMNRRGEWIIPYYNGQPWFEKPILLYWLAKPCLAVFGDAIGPRLPSVLATLATFALVAAFARRHLGASTAIRAVLILAGSLIVVGAGRMMLTDPLLVLCLTGAFCSYWESLVGDWRWRLVTAAALGVAILAKGPVAVLLFGPVALFMAWRYPGWRQRMRKGWGVGSVILFAIVATWYLPAYLESGHLFVQKFLVEQNVGRFTGGDAAHTVKGIAGLLFYVVVILVGMLPWSFQIPDAWRFARDEPISVYLKAWALTIFVFFTISGAKLPHYILPALPALAILIADAQMLARKSIRPLVIWVVLVAFIANAGFIWWYQASGQAEIHALCRFVAQRALKGDLVAEYRMGRQSSNRGTLRPRIQETSEPSTLLYLNRTVIDTDDWAEILRRHEAVWVLTREGRIGAAEQAAMGSRKLELEPDAPPQKFYRLYRLTPAP